MLALIGIDQSQFAAIAQRERAELERRESRYRNGRPRVSLDGRTAVVVDDGIATGSTARVACQVARARARLWWCWPCRWRPRRRLSSWRGRRRVGLPQDPRSIFRRRGVVLGLLPDDRQGSHRAAREGGRRDYADVSQRATELLGHLSEIAVGSHRFAFHRGWRVAML